MELRRRLGNFILGEHADDVRIRSAFKLISTRNLEEAPNRNRAEAIIDDFVRRERGNIWKPFFEEFVDDIMSDRLRFSHLHAASCKHNRLVRDGVSLIAKFLTGQTVAGIDTNNIETLPTVLQLGEDGNTTHSPNYVGCIDPITTTGLVAAAATVTRVNSGGSYTSDIIRLQKSDFNNGIGTTVTVNEIAMLTTDTPNPYCLCRVNTAVTPVTAGGNLDATYQIQIVP